MICVRTWLGGPHQAQDMAARRRPGEILLGQHQAHLVQDVLLGTPRDRASVVRQTPSAIQTARWATIPNCCSRSCLLSALHGPKGFHLATSPRSQNRRCRAWTSCMRPAASSTLPSSSFILANICVSRAFSTSRHRSTPSEPTSTKIFPSVTSFKVLISSNLFS